MGLDVETEALKVQLDMKMSRDIDDALGFTSVLSIPVYATRERPPDHVLDNHIPLAVLSTGIDNIFVDVHLSFEPG
jgi:hypothetical protein